MSLPPLINASSPQNNSGHPAYSYSDVVKKNKSLSQINRLQRRAKARAEEFQSADKAKSATLII